LDRQGIIRQEKQKEEIMSLSRGMHRIPIKRGKTEKDKATERSSLKEKKNSEQERVKQKVETPEHVLERESVDWRAQTARLQADLERCYQRQNQRIETHVNERQAEFLRSFLNVVDNLEQALAHLRREDPLMAGVQTTHRDMLTLLRRHGVEPMEAQGEPFDPFLHEAEGFMPAPPDQDVPLKVIEVTRRGYRRGERVLRPAHVIVARRDA